MKMALIILSSVVLLFAAEDSTTGVVKIGSGPKIGSDGFGVSGRIWVKERFGLSINAGSTFDMKQESGEIQFNYKFFKPSIINPYLLVGGGIQRINIEDMNPPRINEPVGTFSAGAGAEVFLGSTGRHGFSAEAAWRSGSVIYQKRSETAIGDDAQHNSQKKLELVHPSAKLLYHFYFVPWPKREKTEKAEPIQEVPVADTAKAEPIQEAPVVETAKAEPIQEAPVVETAKAEPIQEAPVVETAKAEPVKEVPVIDTAKAEPIQEVPVIDTAKAEPIQEVPVIDTAKAEPIQEVPVIDTAKAEPIQEVPVVEKVVEPELAKEELAALNAVFSNTISFGSNSADLAQSLIAVLDQLVDTLKAYPNLKLRIEGHTDITGNPEINRRLSQDRADLVKHHLTNSGIESDRITTEGLGSDKPKADNSTDEGRTKNRRVELIISP